MVGAPRGARVVGAGESALGCAPKDVKSLGRWGLGCFAPALGGWLECERPELEAGHLGRRPKAHAPLVASGPGGRKRM